MTIEATPYLYFRGSCAPALEFYASVGLGTIVHSRTWDGTPAVARHGEPWRHKILHALFEGPGIRFFASDGPDSEPMNGCALYVVAPPALAVDLFRRLSEGGRVTVPFARQFWGERYGNFTDRFGVQWAISASEPDPA